MSRLDAIQEMLDHEAIFFASHEGVETRMDQVESSHLCFLSRTHEHPRRR